MNIRKISVSRSMLAFSGGVLLLGAAILDCSTNSSGGVGSTTGTGGSNQTGLGGSSNTSTGGSTNTNTGGNPGGTNAGGATAAGGGPGTGAGGVTGAGGLTGLGGGVSTGAGGAPGVVEKQCAHKIVAMNPVFTDFETYNGMSDFSTFGFAFGGAAPGTGTAYGGAYAYSGVLQATGMPNFVLSAVAGHTGTWAAGLTITNETQWGGAMAFWLNCVDASAYRGGISFWARGMSPRAVFGVSIDTEDTSLPDAVNPAGGGTCVGTNTTCKGPSLQEIPLTLDWTQHMLPWSSFVGGLRGGSPYTLTGSNIVGITFSVGLVYENCVPIPGVDGGFTCTPTPSDFSFQLDEISFIP